MIAPADTCTSRLPAGLLAGTCADINTTRESTGGWGTVSVAVFIGIMICLTLEVLRAHEFP